MELVRGKPITEYCDAHRFTTRDRLQLFMDVCHAVQHAHLKGIIHRDIKPSNVLVEIHDVKPVVKVIDFGIAKATGQQLTDKTLYTGVAQMVGTPLYMSPEQAGLSSLDVDTRSDVYSLGVLLYELLTGTTPFDNETLKKAGYDEMRRIIREDEPPRPSARLSTMQQAHLSTIAEQRGLEPHRLSQHLRGELDWIVMRALEKDRNRRYESASAFAADVQRYLNDEQVLACPPSAGYRLRKFARRHKAGLGVAACLLVVLMVGCGFLWRELGQRAAAEDSVEAALQRAEVLREQERWQEAAAVLAVAQGQLRGRWLQELRMRVEQAQRDIDMLMDMENARLQSFVSGKETNSDTAVADQLYNLAFLRYGVDTTLDPEEITRHIETSSIRSHLTNGLDDWARWREANLDPEGSQALRTIARLVDDDPWRQAMRGMAERADRASLEWLAEQKDTMTKPPSTLRSLAHSLRNVGNWALAERVLRRAQAAHPDDFWLNFELAYTIKEKKAPEAGEKIRFYQAALALHPRSVISLYNLGLALHDKGKFDEAIIEYRKAIELKPDFVDALTNLGNVLVDKGRLDESITEYRKALKLNPNQANAHQGLGIALTRKDMPEEAIPELRKAIELKPDNDVTHYSLAAALSDIGKYDEAIAESRRAIDLNPDSSPAHNNWGLALARKGQLDEAIGQFRAAIRLKEDNASAHIHLGQSLCLQGHFAEGLTALRRGHELGLRQPRWRLPSAELVKRAEEQAKLAGKLPKVLSGEVKPADAAERLALALMCQEPKKLNRAAYRLYKEAFAMQPNLADDMKLQNRYNAACAAAQAGCGQGKDADQTDEKERAGLRHQASTWLRADLAAWRQLLEKESDKTRAVVQRTLQHWQEDTDFAGVRDPKALSKLPEDERQDWQKLWQEVETLRKSAREPAK
jgi:tetratricopeptide (TPR) repeat protein